MKGEFQRSLEQWSQSNLEGTEYRLSIHAFDGDEVISESLETFPADTNVEVHAITVLAKHNYDYATCC